MAFLASLLRKIIPLAILAAAIAGFIALRATGPESPPPSSSERLWHVQGLVVALDTHQPTLELYGRTQSPDTQTLRAMVDGQVAELPVRAGQIVATGDLLLRLDANETELVLRQREAEVEEAVAAVQQERSRAQQDRRLLQREQELLAIAQRSQERAEDLRARGVGSEAAVDEAQRSLQQARLTVDLRQQAINEAPQRLQQAEARQARAEAARNRALLDQQRTTLIAQDDMRVLAVQTSPGERVRVGDPLLRIAPLQGVEIQSSLPQALIPLARDRIDAGTPLEAEALVDGTTLRAQLLRIAGESVPGEAGLNGFFAVTEGASSLALNRFVALRVYLPPEPNSLVIPYQALYGQDQVYRVVDARMQRLQVERLGEILDGDGRSLALIRHPELADGDHLVATRLPNAVDGLSVHISEFWP